ncbi:signal peptidase I [Caldibacillus lycopersici]|uniref:Signal peptidase I n=1 Tax=Perspicuibacillus lycopersici TaxID=1325689 RepID=A0AAE3IWR3_9BACI|nr:signal peptidase I [Perspicuibacillus lycopersici]MCU9614809.1 signal peptidase I [Perspicuibacillus lycopersici]
MGDSLKKEIFSWLKIAIIAFVIAFIFRHYFFYPTTVYGESMEPTFHNLDRVLISKISDIQRFDIIVFHAPDSNDYYIKRVIGLPGDTIEMKNDVLYVNGKATKESYLENSKKNTFGNFTKDFSLQEVTGQATVPKGSLFVLGDNRLRSNDSRIFGYVPVGDVVGEVNFQYYPIKDIGLLK